MSDHSSRRRLVESTARILACNPRDAELILSDFGRSTEMKNAWVKMVACSATGALGGALGAQASGPYAPIGLALGAIAGHQTCCLMLNTIENYAH